MPRFSANVSMLFTEHPFLERFAAAAKAGFKAVEFQFPYDFDKDEIADRVRSAGLIQSLFNFPPGDFAAGERGMACLPDRVREFQDSIGLGIAYAKVIGCERLNVSAGIKPPGADADRLFDTFVANLRFAATECAKEGIMCLTEPINYFDIPGYYLNRTADAAAVLDAVGSDNLFIEYDVYHMQRMEGELARTLEANIGRIRNIQVADNPGRHEPGTGEINYPFIFALIDRLGYDGWVGCEYAPASGTENGLGWMAPYR
jgi:hydroxypyruvate isomerase